MSENDMAGLNFKLLKKPICFYWMFLNSISEQVWNGRDNIQILKIDSIRYFMQKSLLQLGIKKFLSWGDFS